MATYYEKNKEKALEYQKEYNKNNFYKIQKYYSNYWSENKDELLMKRKEYEKNNRWRMHDMRKKWYEDKIKGKVHNQSLHVKQYKTKETNTVLINRDAIVRFA